MANPLLQWFKTSVRLFWEVLRDALPMLAALFRRLLWHVRRCRRQRRLPERERRRAPSRCVPINEPAYKRPDPMIYSQAYLMKLGYAVTWDNPDVQLYESGVQIGRAHV